LSLRRTELSETYHKVRLFLLHSARRILIESIVRGLPENMRVLCPGHVTEMTPPKAPTIKPLQGTKPDLYKYAISTRVKGGSLLSTKEQKDSFAKARKQAAELASTRIAEPGPGDDFRITTLGTGSALPSKYRNGEPRIQHYLRFAD
jgi:hypothetical protein